MRNRQIVSLSVPRCSRNQASHAPDEQFQTRVLTLGKNRLDEGLGLPIQPKAHEQKTPVVYECWNRRVVDGIVTERLQHVALGFRVRACLDRQPQQVVLCLCGDPVTASGGRQPCSTTQDGTGLVVLPLLSQEAPIGKQRPDQLYAIAVPIASGDPDGAIEPALGAIRRPHPPGSSTRLPRTNRSARIDTRRSLRE